MRKFGRTINDFRTVPGVKVASESLAREITVPAHAMTVQKVPSAPQIIEDIPVAYGDNGGERMSTYNKIGLGTVTITKGSTGTLSYTNKVGNKRVRGILFDACFALTGADATHAVVVSDLKIAETVKLAGSSMPLSVYAPDNEDRGTFIADFPGSSEIEISLKNLTDASGGVDVVVSAVLVVD